MNRAELTTVLDDSNVEVHQQTGVDGGMESGDLHKKPVLVADRNDNEAEVAGGALKIVQCSGTPLAIPEQAVGTDAYATVMLAPRECHHITVYCESAAGAAVVVSIDGGYTDALVVMPNTQLIFDGVLIPKGAAISVRNMSAGTAYSNLRMAIW